MNRIRRSNRIIVHTGKDKGKQDTVLAALAEHVTVEGVNVAKKHMRPNLMPGIMGSAVNKVMPIHVSNVALMDANGKPSRVGIRVEGGTKTCVLKTTGAAVDAWFWAIERS